MRDLSEAQLTIGISQQQRKDLALLLGAQDGQERWRWPSVHKVKSTLHFVIILVTVQACEAIPYVGAPRIRDAEGLEVRC
jgi:hypothetical protein